MSTEDQEFDIAALEREEAGSNPSRLAESLSTVASAVAEAAGVHDVLPNSLVDPDEVENTTHNDATSTSPDVATDSEAEDQLEDVEIEEVVNPCLKCGVEKDPDFPMCRSCGYYETLDTFVEVDDDNPDAIVGADSGGFKMPTWGWTLIAIQVVIILESLFVTFNFASGSVVRTAWSLAQLLIGFCVALAAHARATFLNVMEDAEADIGDFFMKPFKVWGAVIGGLPKSFPWLAMVTSGLMAVLLSLCLIRSIPFNKLFESDAPPPKAPNLAKAIAEQAKEAEDPDMTMEEALDEFAGEAMDEEEEEEENPRVHEQGVIIGYYAPDGNASKISSIIVATAVKKKLEIFGTFSTGLDDDMKAKLAEDFSQIRRKSPFVKTSLAAKWVHPIYLCEISYELDNKEQPRELRFERIVGKSKLPRRKK